MKRRVGIGWLLAILAAACSSSSDEPSGPCAPRSGTYLEHLRARSGDCGSYAEAVVVVDDQTAGGVPEGCSGTATASADNCTVTLDLACPLPTLGAGYVGAWKGNARWAVDGSSASGVIEYSVTEGVAHRCQGVFDVEFSRR